MHPSYKRIWIPGLVILAALVAATLWALSISPRVFAEPELASGPDSSSGWRVGEPVTYETLTVFPVLSSHQADTADFETLDAALASKKVSGGTAPESVRAAIADLQQRLNHQTKKTGATP